MLHAVILAVQQCLLIVKGCKPLPEMVYSSSSSCRSSAMHCAAKYQNTAFTLISSLTEVFINLAPNALDSSSASFLKCYRKFLQFFSKHPLVSNTREMENISERENSWNTYESITH